MHSKGMTAFKSKCMTAIRKSTAKYIQTKPFGMPMLQQRDP